MAHPNEDLVRKGYEALGEGDLERVAQLLSPDIVWHVTGRNLGSGDYKGVKEVVGFLTNTMEWARGTLTLETHDVIANDTHAAVLVTETAERDGKLWTDDQVHVMHVADGKITEFWNHPGDPYATDEFWS